MRSHFTINTRKMTINVLFNELFSSPAGCRSIPYYTPHSAHSSHSHSHSILAAVVESSMVTHVLHCIVSYCTALHCTIDTVLSIVHAAALHCLHTILPPPPFALPLPPSLSLLLMTTPQCSRTLLPLSRWKLAPRPLLCPPCRSSPVSAALSCPLSSPQNRLHRD